MISLGMLLNKDFESAFCVSFNGQNIFCMTNSSASNLIELLAVFCFFTQLIDIFYMNSTQQINM